MNYTWQHPNWPHYTYDLSDIQNTLYLYAKESAEISGGLNQISKPEQQDALLDIIIAEALRTSEIEGEYYTEADIRSSLRNQLGLAKTPETVRDKQANNIARLMIESRESFHQDLTSEMLFFWHKILLRDSPYAHTLIVGGWRTSQEPMQIVSCPIGHEKIHYAAPPSARLPQEIEQFIQWYNETATSTFSGPVRAAIAHLYFETLHPFDDGNGRLGRILSEKALAQDLKRPILLSLSQEILKNKNDYYRHLSKASHGDLDITPWIHYFVTLTYQAQLSTKKMIEFVLFQSKFWRRFSTSLNDRQMKAIQKLFKAGIQGFTGGLSAKKYGVITGAPKPTATRDLRDLYQKGCLIRLPGEGRNTRYDLPFQDHIWKAW